MLRIRLFFCLLCFSLPLFGQEITSKEELIGFLSGKDKLVDHVLKNRERYRLQMVYTRGSSMDEVKTVEFTSGHYFFPASVVKLPIALLTLEKLKQNNLSRTDYLRFNEDVVCGNQTFVKRSKKRKITFNEMLSELIVVSDNHYYNSLYHFLRPNDINRNLKEKGYRSTKIYKAFTGCNGTGQLKSNSFEVYSETNKLIYSEDQYVFPKADFEKEYSYDKTLLLGEKHENKNGLIVDGPFDFNYNLELSLMDIHEMLMRLIYPDKFPEEKRWKINEEDRKYIIELLGMVPGDLENQKFSNQEKYPDNLYKYIAGDHLDVVKTYSKLGLSYGFATETAFVSGGEEGPFFLTISMYVNNNKVVNDGKYEYEELARPFMTRVGEILQKSQ